MLTPERVLEDIRAKLDHPATLRELMQKLGLPREQRVSLRRRLATLVAAGALIKVRGNRYGLPGRMRLVTGRAHVHPRGFGFVKPDHPVDGLAGDLYIAGANLNQAMHGDRVVARIDSRPAADRSEGRIVRILERAAERLVGRYDVDEAGLAYVLPFDRRLVMDVHVPAGEVATAAPGDMVSVELTRWPTAARGPVGRVSEVLGDIDAPGVDTRLIICKHHLPDEHDPAAVAEAAGAGDAVQAGDIAGRRDFRGWQTVTIDGETARDFDDAVTLERLPNGNYWLGVHIADVAHYVPEGSALDAAALERGTSVYFPDRAIHMFPAALATGVCSLRPAIDRLVQSCLMEIDARGTVLRHEFHDGVIHSDARLTYGEVNAILTDRDPAVRAARAPLVPLLESMAELFEALHARRRRRGSIDFDLPAAEFLLDDEGRVEAIVAAERNLAHRLIEEFMLVANETVAGHLERCRVPVLFRVHEAPDPSKIAEFEAFTASLGFSLGVPADRVAPGDFRRLLERLRGEPAERPVAFLMLRAMQQARYDPANLGHFGLAAATYTHFTSPIRRYPDLIVHRALRESRARSPAADVRAGWLEDLPELARHTSARERRAEEAEREIVQWKKVRFMADKVGDEFTGYVTGVTAFGLFVELIEHFVEGLVHISSMADDYYRYVEGQHALRGENTRKVYRLGDPVHVQLVRVDRDHRQLELALVEILDSVRRAEGRPGRTRRRSGRRGAAAAGPRGRRRR